MLHYPHFNPIAFTLGPLKVHWYGLMYLFGFSTAWLLALKYAKQSKGIWKTEQVSDLIFYAALGVVLGGRLGYMLFYNFSALVAHPLVCFKVWQGGMSFHGGLLGVGLATWIYSLRYKKNWGDVLDFTVPIAPMGIGAGRFGNFINGELWGRVTTVPWAMVFPNGGPCPRHPSQLYECLLEGVLLFIMTYWFSSKRRPRLAVTAFFLMSYGFFRFSVEFFRQPDFQLGFVAFHCLTIGQLLSLPMILVGGVLLSYSYTRTPL